MDKVKIQAFFMPMLFLITGISVIIIIWLGGRMVINGELTLGEIIAFVAYLSLLIWPVIAFGWVINIVQQASASMKRLLKIFGEEDDIRDIKSTGVPINKLKGDRVKKGETLAIIGHTGSGKTTLINLIPRLFDTTEGEIMIDGKNVKNIPKSLLRQSVGMVSQETFLFSDTLSNNIAYGLKYPEENIIDQVSQISNLKKDIDTFSKGYDTILGERGITLSGGQKQRASLARALAVNPKILILDDAFSAVDTNTEEQILNNLKEFMNGRTSIIISHRISTVKNADNIIVLENGIIVEEGNHDELIELGGLYADLHQKQLLEEELKELA